MPTVKVEPLNRGEISVLPESLGVYTGRASWLGAYKPARGGSIELLREAKTPVDPRPPLRASRSSWLFPSKRAPNLVAFSFRGMSQLCRTPRRPASPIRWTR